jgi:hypothetical protein
MSCDVLAGDTRVSHCDTARGLTVTVTQPQGTMLFVDPGGPQVPPLSATRSTEPLFLTAEHVRTFTITSLIPVPVLTVFQANSVCRNCETLQKAAGQDPYRLNRAPALSCALVAMRVIARAVQDADAHPPIRVDCAISHALCWL